MAACLWLVLLSPVLGDVTVRGGLSLITNICSKTELTDYLFRSIRLEFLLSV